MTEEIQFAGLNLCGAI